MRRLSFSSICGLLAVALIPCLGALLGSLSPVASPPPRPDFSAFAEYKTNLPVLDEKRSWLNPACAALKA